MNRPRNALVLPISLAAISLFSATGCRSRLVDTTIVNQGPDVHVLEFDYPSASFGADKLASGSRFHYRFNIQGPGALSMTFEDLAGKSHKSDGPIVDRGQQGTLVVTIDPQNHVSWQPHLTRR